MVYVESNEAQCFNEATWKLTKAMFIYVLSKRNGQEMGHTQTLA